MICFRYVPILLLLLFLLSNCSYTSQGSKGTALLKEVLQEGNDWVTYHYDNQRRAITGNVLNFPLKFVWRYKIRGRLKMFSVTENQGSSPAVVDGIVYIGNSVGKFYALDSRKKKKLWEFSTDGGVKSSPTVYGGKVFFGTDKGVFYSLNAIDGKVNWTYQVSSPILSSPLVEDDIVFFNTLDSKVYALDTQTGEKLWQYIRKTPKKIQRAFAPPSFFNGKLYVGFSDGSLVALSSHDGEKKIDVLIGKKNESFMPPLHSVIVDGLIYVVTPGMDLLVLGENGKKLWSFETTRVSDFIVTKNKVFLVNHEGEVFAINKITGENLWKRKVSKGRPTHVIISGSHLIISTKYASTFLNLEFLSNEGGYIEAFKMNTGDRDWSYNSNSGVSSSPVVADNKLFFVTDDGYIHIFESS